MYGVWMRNGRRPESKKAMREALAGNHYIILHDTSMFGPGPDIAVGGGNAAPDGTYVFVGPDPYTARKFFGQVVVKGGKVVVR